MPEFRAKYSEDERAAIVEAGLDKGIKPISTICRLAAAGELTLKGEKIPAFTIPNPTASGYVGQARRGREGRILSDLGSAPPRDAMEQMRRELVNLAHYELRRVDKASKRSKKPVDPEHGRRIARWLREIAAIPGQDQSRLPVAPGIHAQNGERDGAVRDGLAGSILRADKPRSAPTYTPDMGVAEQGLESVDSSDGEGWIDDGSQGSDTGNARTRTTA